MTPLEVNQRVLIWLCGLPARKHDDKQKKLAHILLTLCVIIAHLVSVVAGSVFIYRNILVSLEDALFSLFHTLSSSTMLYQSIVTVFLCRELASMFDGLSKIYNESKCKRFFYK